MGDAIFVTQCCILGRSSGQLSLCAYQVWEEFVAIITASYLSLFIPVTVVISILSLIVLVSLLTNTHAAEFNCTSAEKKNCAPCAAGRYANKSKSVLLYTCIIHILYILIYVLDLDGILRCYIRQTVSSSWTRQ